jgi:hypothetical protein
MCQKRKKEFDPLLNFPANCVATINKCGYTSRGRLIKNRAAQNPLSEALSRWRSVGSPSPSFAGKKSLLARLAWRMILRRI